MNDATAIALLLEDLDDAEGLYECYGETYAQYRSEIGLYGDAWPGSALEIGRMEAAVAEMDATAALVRAISPPWVNPVIDLSWTGCEEPF